MRYTNKLNLPASVVRAITNDGYSKGESDFSVTELLKPSRQWALQKQHEAEIVEDISDRLWALYGKMGHKLFEDQAVKNELVETRFFVNIDKSIVSAQIDNLCLESGTLSDYKFTSSWGFMANRPPKAEWVAQLNMQRFILSVNGHSAQTMQIIGLLRDWQIREADKNADYPQTPICVMPIPIWSLADTKAYISERVKSHKAALEKLPDCTLDDLWFRKGKFTRCESYCAVSKFCSQFNQLKENQK